MSTPHAMRLPLTQVTVGRAVFDGPPLDYTSVMIDRKTWEALGRPVEVEVTVTAVEDGDS